MKAFGSSRGYPDQVKINALAKKVDVGLLKSPRFVNLLAILGGFVYFVQTWHYAHTQLSILDEGAYLVKGLLFATGKYQPFQSYGPWTNHMPLSYLIPGVVQMIFGPGLRTGRYLSIFLGVLMLVGLWIVSQRLGGKFWAAGLVWAMALNPAVIKMYSVVASQGLVACILVWALVFALGENRPRWQIIMGAALVALVPLTRVNMTPVFPFVIGYIFWEHGRRLGLWSTLVSATLFGGGQAWYWPNILTLWVKWFPPSLTPFLNTWRPTDIGTPFWQPTVNIFTRLISFIEGLRFNFVPVIGVVVVLILWPPKSRWKKASDYRIAVFLLSLFCTLWVMHAWASLGKNYCVFCYSAYLSFFSVLGLLVIPASYPYWTSELTGWRRRVVIFVILMVPVIVGISLSNYLAGTIVTDPFVRQLIRTPVPRLNGFEVLPGKIELWGFLSNIFGWDYVAIQLGTKRFISSLIAALIGFSGGVLILWVSGPLSARRYRFSLPYEKFATALIIFLGLGFFLSPTAILGGGRDTYDCSGDVISSYEAAGNYLADLIPSGALVFWRGGLSTVPLLYLDEIEIYPPQLNNDYSFRNGGNPDTLVKYGFWNEELAHQWAQEADVILIEDRYFKGWLVDQVNNQAYGLYPPTPKTAQCRKDSAIHIFWRKP